MSASNPLWTSIRYDERSGCWNWTGFRNTKGYGKRWYNGRKEMVHRIAMHLWRGFDLKSRLLVLHSCDNPSCFNPKHLFAGTAMDNTKDAISKGRLKGAPRKISCIHGHPRTPENVYHKNGACLICMRLATKEKNKRRKYGKPKAIL